jgi:hypothetical protein
MNFYKVLPLNCVSLFAEIGMVDAIFLFISFIIINAIISY